MRTAFFVLWAAPALAADELVLAPAADVRLETVVRESSRFTLDTATLERDGRRVQDPPGYGLAVTNERSARWVDEIGAVAEGRVERFARRFEAVDGAVRVDVDEPERGGELAARVTSELAELAIAFERDGDEWTRAYADGIDRGDELLEGLAGTLDASALLPGGAVEPGARWLADADALAPLLAAGGDLAFEPDVFSGDRHAQAALLAFWWSSYELAAALEGPVELEYLGPEPGEEGIGLVRVEYELAGRRDATEALLDAAERTSVGPTDPYGLESYVVEYGLEGQGTLRWDLTAGRLAGAELRGRAHILAELTELLGSSDDPPATAPRSRLTLALRGETTVAVEVEEL